MTAPFLVKVYNNIKIHIASGLMLLAALGVSVWLLFQTFDYAQSIGIIGGGAALLGLLKLREKARAAVLEVTVTSGGLHVRTATGATWFINWNDEHTLRYKEMRARMHGIPLGTFYNIILENTLHQKVNVGSLGREHRDYIVEASTGAQYRRLWQEFKNGNMLRFGNITLTPSSVVLKSTEIPWSKIKKSKLYGGWLIIFSKNRLLPYFFKIFKVPNILVLYRFLNTLPHGS